VPRCRRPRAFEWRAVRYAVAEVLGAWHPQDRWWERERESDRTYYRVRTPDHQVLDMYFDDVPGVWVLDRAHD
jgi:Family of unknown function (DUF6504)